MVTYRLTEGLGDCLIAAACCQELSIRTSRKIGFITNPLLVPYLGENNYIDIKEDKGDFIQLKWVSQLDQPTYALHTSQRFSHQMGFMIDPTKVVDLFIRQKHGSVVRLNNSGRNEASYICINKTSKEAGRRFLSKEMLLYIEEWCTQRGLGVVYIGDGGTTKIDRCITYLEGCRFFIGPVSFMYHLASAIHTPCLLATGYMPDYKFSHFFNTISLPSPKWCVSNCESDEEWNRSSVGCDVTNTCYAQSQFSLLELGNKLEEMYQKEFSCL